MFVLMRLFVFERTECTIGLAAIALIYTARPILHKVPKNNDDQNDEGSNENV